jgi:two-component system nitrogen regulation response regulator GlnG
LKLRVLEACRDRQDPTSPLIGNSPAMQKLRVQLQQYADLPFSVLIEGESGSGKEVIACTCLHHHTKRCHRPFLALNCAAISPNLVEAMLFGYVRGAFTDAIATKAGYFEEAADGTLFLDEIGELASDLQAKLLRVLENGEYQRVGEARKRVSQARIIAATNRDLRREVKAGNFRADLYHRLSVCSIVAPPLREMANDKLLLLEHFRQHYATQMRQRPFTLAADAELLWLGYPFPGNVRELRNIVIRLTTQHPGQMVAADALAVELDLPDETPRASGDAMSLSSGSGAQSGDPFVAAAAHRLCQREPFDLDRLLEATERGYIDAALKLAHGNVSQAARLLGIRRTTLYNRMESSSREP